MGTTQGRGADAPIGIFDSGVGGLTVARAVLDQLPNEAVRYIGDTAHGPYGPLPIAEVRRHSLAVMDDLVAGVDTVVLGCTHYPLLTGVLSLVLGDDVTLVSSAEETAKDVYRVLTRADLLRDEDAPPPEHAFLATGDPEPFARLGRRFLGPEIGAVLRAESVGAA
jgi:glutamate racemase